MDEVLSERDFADKVQWEGSLVDAFIYGLTPANCEPGDLRDLLAPAFEAYLALDKASAGVVDYIEEIIYGEEE